MWVVSSSRVGEVVVVVVMVTNDDVPNNLGDDEVVVVTRRLQSIKVVKVMIAVGVVVRFCVTIGSR